MAQRRLTVDEEVFLDKALKNVRRQNFLIANEIERNNLRFILKQAFNLLCELRSDYFSPKNYQTLYNQVITELFPIYNYMNVEVSRGREPWDIFESVQQCRYVIPKLYLIILSASIYIENSPDKCKEILDELLEFMKQSQSPIRTLFVRYYLVQMLKGKLPDGDNKYIKEGGCTIMDTIDFLIKNLEEMNRAWIRMSLNASPEDLPILENERNDVKRLISDMIEIFSKLEGLNMELFEKGILPRLVDIIFMYDDYISQEYIMECIIVHFPESYIIKNLDFLLLTLSKLTQGVNMKKLFITFLDKFNNYYKKNLDNPEDEEKEKALNEVYSAYPIILRNFNIILEKYEKTIQNIMNILELNLNFLKFCVNCAPKEEKLISINHGLNSTVKSLFSMNASLLFQKQLDKIHDILSIALESIYSIFEMPDFVKLFNFLDSKNKKDLAIEIINNLINVNSHEKLDTLDKIQQLFIYCRPLIKSSSESEEEINERIIEKEQYTLIKLFSILKTKDINLLYDIFLNFKIFLNEGGKLRRCKSYPCMISFLILFCKNISLLYEKKIKENEKYDISQLETDDDFCNFLAKIYNMLIDILKILEEDEPKIALKYSLLVVNQINAINTSKDKFVDICLSIFNNAIEIYKKFDPEKKYEYYVEICQNLLNITIFSKEIYEKIISELITEAKNMTKRTEQCDGLLIISQLYYTHFNDGKKVLEYLSKAQKIAGFSLTNPKNMVLFINILNKYLYYVEVDEKKTVDINKEKIEEIIEYIQNYIVTIKTDKDSDKEFLTEIEKYFNNTINLIKERKNSETSKEIYKLIVINSDNEG